MIGDDPPPPVVSRAVEDEAAHRRIVEKTRILRWQTLDTASHCGTTRQGTDVTGANDA